MTAISMVKGDTPNFWEEGAWIDDILGYAKMFESISFNFIRREANHLAHRLAKREGESNMFFVWVDSLSESSNVL